LWSAKKGIPWKKAAEWKAFSWENDDKSLDAGMFPSLNPFMNHYYGMGYTSEVCEFGLVEFDIPFTH
jgi:hypothetical protein